MNRNGLPSDDCLEADAVLFCSCRTGQWPPQSPDTDATDRTASGRPMAMVVTHRISSPSGRYLPCVQGSRRDALVE